MVPLKRYWQMEVSSLMLAIYVECFGGLCSDLREFAGEVVMELC